MKDNNETFSRLGEYFAAMTELTAGYVKDVANELGGLLNPEDGKNTSDTALDALRESLGIGIRASAKAWVTTRQLMLDLAE